MAQKPNKITPTDMPFAVFSLEADRDYILARFISFLGAGFHSRAGYLAQAACEKYMKAYTVQEAKHYLAKHNLLELADTCQHFDSYFGEVETRRILAQFDIFEQVGRYGGGAKYDPLAIKTPDIETAGVSIWLGSYLQDLDGFVFKVRGLLKFEQGGRMDMLSAILSGDTRNVLVGTWNGPPLMQVLTHNNPFFTAPVSPAPPLA